MLGMNVDKLHRHVGKQVESHRRVVDECARPSCRRDFAAQYAERVVPLDIVVKTVFLQLGIFAYFKRSLDDRLFSGIAHSFQVGTASEY